MFGSGVCAFPKQLARPVLSLGTPSKTPSSYRWFCVSTSQESTTYASANSTHALGSSTSLSIGSPADRSGGGREVTVAAVTDGSISATGTASHYAILDTSNTRLLATGSLSASQSVTSGNTFTLASFKIGIPDPS